MLTFKPTIRSIIILAVVAGVLFCSGIFTFVVCSRHLRTASLDLEAKQKQVLDSKKIAEGLANAQDSYLQTQRELAFLENCVSTHAYVPTLLKQLEALGTSMNLKVVSVRPEKAQPAAPPPIKRTSEDPAAAPETSSGASNTPGGATEEKKPYEELNISIELEGSYWHARDFMYRLTTFPKIMAVRAVQLSPAGAVEGKGSPKLLVRLGVTAFIFQEQGVPQTGPKQSPSSPQPTSAAAVNRRFGNEG